MTASRLTIYRVIFIRLKWKFTAKIAKNTEEYMYVLTWPAKLDKAEILKIFEETNNIFEVKNISSKPMPFMSKLHSLEELKNYPDELAPVRHFTLETEDFGLDWSYTKDSTLPVMSAVIRNKDFLDSVWLQGVIANSRYADTSQPAYKIIEEFLGAYDQERNMK